MRDKPLVRFPVATVKNRTRYAKTKATKVPDSHSDGATPKGARTPEMNRSTAPKGINTPIATTTPGSAYPSPTNVVV